MDWSNDELSGNRNGRSLSFSDDCPFRHVLSVCENGMVVESRRAFEVGSAITLGFHVTSEEGDQSWFVSADSIVVDSRPELVRDGEVTVRVTLLFSRISRKDHSLLLRLSRSHTASAAPVSGPVPARFGLN